MIYFKRNEENIEKYNVTFDKDKIKELRTEIIEKCSFIKHYEFESDYGPRFTKNDIIKNFRRSNTDKVVEYFEETRDVDLYSYDKYIPPQLIDLIDQLLDGYTKAINKILKYEVSVKPTLDDKINEVNQDIINMVPENISQRKEKIEELEKLLKEKELNQNQKSIDEYYEKLLSLIKIDLIDTLPISELEKIESFLGTELFTRENIKEKKLIKTK